MPCVSNAPRHEPWRQGLNGFTARVRRPNSEFNAKPKECMSFVRHANTKRDPRSIDLNFHSRCTYNCVKAVLLLHFLQFYQDISTKKIMNSMITRIVQILMKFNAVI